MSHSADRAHVDEFLREVCEEFDAALEAAANGSVSARYAAVPSWYATDAPQRPARNLATVPTWCIDRATARRLLAEIRGTDREGSR